MKKSVFIALLLAGIIVAGCTHDEPSSNTHQPSPSTVDTVWLDTVVINFARPYEVSAMTRTVQPISAFCTHLDVWIVEGTNTIDIHQSSTDANFGTISAVLDKRKTYTIYAVAHKCATDATLTDGVVSFPDDKVTHSMIYSGTFTPATTTSLSAEMTRIVSVFKLETTDAIPDAAKKMRFTITDVYNRWNFSTGASNKLDRTSEISISSKNNDGTAAFNIYAIATDAETSHTVTVQALDASDAVLQSRTFTDVTLRNGYRTTYRGAFFVDAPFTSTFTVQDWNDYEVVDF